ncbi:Poly [ADP-ribose] polymerase 1 [Camellia lanceoleosa]|uniref:Poly [ADP-ribose] polymerase 1 n=1 Tax=Camellia lanceoleosa TaxID=1840588 RepID=A0ACC0IWV4_9ERIC|nr:Poly [ADP-ribose] polymerase 1 [Camellia lanceoleosa]
MELRILYDDILHKNATYESLVTISFKSFKRIKVQVVLFFFANGVMLETTKLEEANYKICQNQMQFENSNVYSLKKLGTNGKHGKGRNLANSFHWTLIMGVNKEVVPKKKNINDAGSQLAPPLGELMKMLFNAYKAAMMEFEINMSEMALEKLSKSNIQKDTFL